MPEETKCPNMTTPQSQAEALAVEVIKEWRLTGNSLVSCISTALVSPALFESQSAELTKLKSDVERLMGLSTEGKRWMSHDESCGRSGHLAVGEYPACNCGLNNHLRALALALEETK